MVLRGISTSDMSVMLWPWHSTSTWPLARSQHLQRESHRKRVSPGSLPHSVTFLLKDGISRPEVQFSIATIIVIRLLLFISSFTWGGELLSSWVTIVKLIPLSLCNDSVQLRIGEFFSIAVVVFPVKAVRYSRFVLKNFITVFLKSGFLTSNIT